MPAATPHTKITISPAALLRFCLWAALAGLATGLVAGIAALLAR